MKLTEPVRTVLKPCKDKPKLVSFGRGGHTIHFGKTEMYSNVRETGYDTPDNFFAAEQWWAHDYLSKRDEAAFEGCPFVDKRAAVDTAAGYSLVFKGPMVNVDLADDEVDECPQPSDFMAAAMADNSYGSLLTLQKAHKATKPTPGPLDGVSITEYLRQWQAVGAIVGVIRNGQFVAGQLA